MQRHKGSLFWITVPARDGVAVIHQAWQALLPACSQPGADLSDLWSIYCSLCPTHLLPLKYGCHGDAKPCQGPSLCPAVKYRGEITCFRARHSWVQIPSVKEKYMWKLHILSFTWGLIEICRWMALSNCSKEIGGGAMVYMNFLARKYMQSNVCVCVIVTQPCLTLCDPMDCRPPGSSVHGILQTRMLEWVAISLSNVNFSGGSLVAKSYPTLATPQTVACQVFLSMGFSRQEYWSGLPFPSPAVKHTSG